MNVQVVENYNEMSAEGAMVVARQIRDKPSAVIGFATGSTPIGLYQSLIQMHRNEGLDFSHITTFNLDEYVGLKAEDRQSYHSFMYEHLFSHVNVKPAQVYIPNGMAEDLEAHCIWYESEIARFGGLDMQILGIGTNGHLGFNEPGSSLGSRTRVVSLAQTTVRDNARFFGHIDEVPEKAITMGLDTIMDARSLLLLGSGAGKAEAIRASLEGPLTVMEPASVLQLHPQIRFIIDREAASRLMYSHDRGIAEPKD